MGLMAAVLAGPCAGGCARGIAGPSQGCTCGLIWKALHGCRVGKSVPVPELGPSQPAQTEREGAHKAPLFLVWNEWIGGS